MTPRPTLHILAVEKRPYGSEFLPNLLNVVDLGDGKTGSIVNITGEDSAEIDLMEYRDGVDTKRMRVLQSIASGE